MALDDRRTDDFAIKHNCERVAYVVRCIIAKAPRAFTAALASMLSAVTYGPNDCIVRDGEANADLYIVAKGRVQCEDSWAEYVEVAEILEEGGYLGERGLMCHSYSSHTFRTLTFTELWKMDCAQARQEIAKWPIIRKKIRKMVVIKI